MYMCDVIFDMAVILLTRYMLHKTVDMGLVLAFIRVMFITCIYIRLSIWCGITISLVSWLTVGIPGGGAVDGAGGRRGSQAQEWRLSTLQDPEGVSNQPQTADHRHTPPELTQGALVTAALHHAWQVRITLTALNPHRGFISNPCFTFSP